MHGVKNSLNVATAATVCIWEALRQWEASPAGLQRSAEWASEPNPSGLKFPV